jgi:O-acetyl-ADP-ribose deacetylase (regulator of RNase III)
MIVTEIQGDLFESVGPLAHGCNSMGAYAAGVAGLVRERYPIAYKAYASLADTGRFYPGMAQAVYVAKNGTLFDMAFDRWVINLGTQVLPGAHADLDLIWFSMRHAAEFVQGAGRPQVINIPFLGCGIGGLTWEPVRARIESIDSDDRVNAYYL